MGVMGWTVGSRVLGLVCVCCRAVCLSVSSCGDSLARCGWVCGVVQAKGGFS